MRAQGCQYTEVRRGNQQVRGEPVRLTFQVRVQASDALDYQEFLAMFEQVRGFMEKAEPELIIGLMA